MSMSPRRPSPWAALPQRRWLRSVTGAAAFALALAALAAALVRGGVPSVGDIGLAALALVLATPVLAGVIAPAVIAWERGPASFVARLALLAGLAALTWMALRRATGDAIAELGAGSWLAIAAFALCAWVVVFVAGRRAAPRSRSVAEGERRAGRRGGGASGSW